MAKLVEKKTKGKDHSAAAGERQNRVAEAAYYLAEKRGFEPGKDMEDWFMAEIVIDAELKRISKG